MPSEPAAEGGDAAAAGQAGKKTLWPSPDTVKLCECLRLSGGVAQALGPSLAIRDSGSSSFGKAVTKCGSSSQASCPRVAHAGQRHLPHCSLEHQEIIYFRIFHYDDSNDRSARDKTQFWGAGRKGHWQEGARPVRVWPGQSPELPVWVSQIPAAAGLSGYYQIDSFDIFYLFDITEDFALAASYSSTRKVQHKRCVATAMSRRIPAQPSTAARPPLQL